MTHALSHAMQVVVICYAAIAAGILTGLVAYVAAAFVAGRQSVGFALEIVLRDPPQEDRPKSPDLASRLAMSTGPLSVARADDHAPGAPIAAEGARS